MIDALFFSRIPFPFFEATAVPSASDAVTMVVYVGYCVDSGTGGGAGVIVYKYHPMDRPTGTIKWLLFLGTFFFFFLLAPCAFRAAAIEPAERQQK